jgi:hypothetical protein
MLGQIGWPEDYDPMGDTLDENKVSDQIDRAAGAIGADARGNA